MDAKWKTQSVDTSENKHRSHILNTTETNAEIISRADSGETLASIG
jgi:hypothetical protein